jgi:eukaryotic-like serine/threonine-protein kinase
MNHLWSFKFLVLIGLMYFPNESILHAQTGDCWPNFRGDSRLSGVSDASLPDKPALLWNFNAQDGIKAAPVVCDGIIVVGTLEGSLYGIKSDGTLQWKINTENSIEAPAMIVDGVVYVGNLEGTLFAVDLNTGAIKWTYQTDNMIMGSPSFYRKGRKRVILVGSYDYYLHGVDPETGEGLWKYETDNFINGSCAIYDGMAVFGGCDGYLHMVDAITGKEKSSMSISTYVASSAGIDRDYAYVGDYDGYFSEVDLKGEKVSWVFENKEANLPFIGSPALYEEHVYIGNRDKFVYCLNKNNGKLVWKYNTAGQVDASPVVVGNRLLIANMRGDLFLLDRKDGKVLWTYELGTAVNSNPAVVDNRIYVAGDDGRLYCFGTK